MNVDVWVPGPPVAHERLAPDDRRDGHPATDPLADRHQVRDDAPVVGRPGPTGPPEARLDLVEDEDRAVTVAQLAQPGQEPVRRDDDAAVALDRLDDDRRDRPDAGGRILQRVTDQGQRLAHRPRRPARAASEYAIRVGQELGVGSSPPAARMADLPARPTTPLPRPK